MAMALLTGSLPAILHCRASSSSSSSSSFSSPPPSLVLPYCHQHLRRGVSGFRVSCSRLRVVAMADTAKSESRVEEKLGVRIERGPSEARLQELGIRSWPKWGCPASTFPWTYDGKETCFLLQGKVKVYPEGSSDFVEFGAGDLVVFPKGMSCTWEVSQAVDKHYQFEY